MQRGKKSNMECLKVISNAIILSKNLKKEAWIWISTSFSLFISILSLFEVNPVNAILISLLLSIIIQIGFFIYKYSKYANKGKYIKRGSTKINVKFGDICEEKGIKLIPCEENLLKGNSSSIPAKSIQAQYFKKYDEKVEFMENSDSDGMLKHTKILNNGCCLFSVIKLDEKTMAKCTVEEYVIIIFKLCKLIEKVAKKETVFIPIVGSGIKKSDRDMCSIDCLNLIITILKLYSFNRDTTVSIVVNRKKHSMEDINLFLID